MLPRVLNTAYRSTYSVTPQPYHQKLISPDFPYASNISRADSSVIELTRSRKSALIFARISPSP